jgi:hypothetical protein
VLFIGNDVPEKETGRPNAQDLAQGLSRKWKEVAASNLAAAAKGLQQWQIRAYLDQALPQDSEPGPLLRTIAQLPVPFLVSAAFDILLERALKDAGRSASRLIDDRDLEQRRHGQPDLIKVAGDLRRPASLIVTDERYRAMPDKRRYQLFSLLEAWLVEKSLLFIGCDPAVDGDFEQRIFPLLTRNLSLSDLDAYLVWPDLSPTESELWRQQNVTFVDDQPQEFLESLANLLDGTIV